MLEEYDEYKIIPQLETGNLGILCKYKNINIPDIKKHINNYNYHITNPKIMTHILSNSDPEFHYMLVNSFLNSNCENHPLFQNYIDVNVVQGNYNGAMHIFLLLCEHKDKSITFEDPTLNFFFENKDIVIQYFKTNKQDQNQKQNQYYDFTIRAATIVARVFHGRLQYITKSITSLAKVYVEGICFMLFELSKVNKSFCDDVLNKINNFYNFCHISKKCRRTIECTFKEHGLIIKLHSKKPKYSYDCVIL